MKNIALLSLAFLTLIGFQVKAQDALTVINAGFETDSFSGNFSVPHTITGWSSPLSATAFNNVGLASSSYHSFTGDTSGKVGVLASYLPTSFGGFPATIYQSGISSVDPGDKFYTFSIDLAQDSSHAYSTPGSFTLTLSDTHGLLSQETFSTTNLLSNDFQPFSITGYAPGTNSFTIELSVTGHGALLADNASLSGSAVPEPSSWGWIPFLGTLGFLAFRRFRQSAV